MFFFATAPLLIFQVKQCLLEMSGQCSSLASAPSFHQVIPHTIHLCHKQLPPHTLPACALGTRASQHTPVANWDLTFLMTAFNTALWISFPEKVSGSEAELFVQNICKNEASLADVITSQNMSDLWWKNVFHFSHDAWQFVPGKPVSASERGQAKVQVKIMMERGFACVSNRTCYFLQSFYVLLVYLDVMFILLGSYLHIPVFWSRNTDINTKKGWFSIFPSKFNPLNLKVKPCSCDT